MKQSKRNRTSRILSIKQLTAGVAIASIIGLGATVANANSWGFHGAMMGGQSGMGQSGMGQSGMGQGMMGHGRGMQPGQFIEGRLAFLKTELGITDSQQQVWDEFAGFMRAQAKTMQEQMQQRQAHWQQHMQQNKSEQKSMDKPMDQAEQSPLDHMQKSITHMQERTARMQAGLEAMNKLYSALTPEQQAKAKNLLGSHMM